MPISNKPAETPLVATTFTGATDIYQNTPMIEIPSRMRAWGLAVLGWFIDNNAAGTAKINSATNAVTAYLNDTVIPYLNNFETTLNEAWAAYQSNLNAAWAAYQSNLNAAWAAYQSNLNSNIGTLVGTGAGYSIDQSNSLVMHGEETITYKANGLIDSITSGTASYTNMTYDSQGLLKSATESITVAGITYTNTLEFN